ncbi:MAG: hypothetical protein HYV75_09760 [Opitutae bacterium]|nr:hypothetical protein [Opitutae bacterium]
MAKGNRGVTVLMGESSTAPDSSTRYRVLVGLAMLAPAVFALVTGNIWEDFFITFRCSLNLAQGHGLVYEAGRVVHVFTSPLGVLMPAAISWVLRTDDPQLVLWVFRLAACLALGGAWVLTAGRVQSSLALGVTAGLWLFDAKLAAYATNGMETGILVLFVMLAWRALLDRRVGLAGLALGGIMWTRPDGFVFVAALGAAAWLFPRETRLGWRDWFRIIAWGVALYAPWILIAGWYYGSPVPNTILAKGVQMSDPATLRQVLLYPFTFVFGRNAAHDAFMPPYYFFGGWPGQLWWLGKLLALGAAAAAAWPRCARPARVAGLAFVLGGLYLTITPVAPWYCPAWQVLAYVAFGGLVAAGWEWSRLPRTGRLLVGAGAAGLIVVQAALFLAVCAQLRAQQRVIEWGVRRQIGLELRQAAHGPQETVFLEPLGYIGFYSGLAMRDTPGLCAPEVVALRRSGIRSMAGLIAAVRPDWAVLRASEYAVFTPAELAAFQRDYRLWKIHDVRRQVNEIAWLPGRDFLLFDAFYTIWRRVPPAPAQ